MSTSSTPQTPRENHVIMSQADVDIIEYLKNKALPCFLNADLLQCIQEKRYRGPIVPRDENGDPLDKNYVIPAKNDQKISTKFAIFAKKLCWATTFAPMVGLNLTEAEILVITMSNYN